MARITVPLDEAIRVLTANVDLGNFIKRIDATAYGPRLVIGFQPVMRETAVLIRFVKFESGTALFALDNIPSFLNLNTILKLPRGITVSGTLLKIQPDVLIRAELNLKGLYVKNVAWDNGTYIIDIS
jgi:hypothetical protein